MEISLHRPIHGNGVDIDALKVRVKPLTPDERKWLRRLERVLKDMPERLWLMECADSLLLLDREAAHLVDIEDGNARRNGVVLADVKHSVMKVTASSG